LGRTGKTNITTRTQRVDKDTTIGVERVPSKGRVLKAPYFKKARRPKKRFSLLSVGGAGRKEKMGRFVKKRLYIKRRQTERKKEL